MIAFLDNINWPAGLCYYLDNDSVYEAPIVNAQTSAFEAGVSLALESERYGLVNINLMQRRCLAVITEHSDRRIEGHWRHWFTPSNALHMRLSTQASAAYSAIFSCWHPHAADTPTPSPDTTFPSDAEPFSIDNLKTAYAIRRALKKNQITPAESDRLLTQLAREKILARQEKFRQRHTPFSPRLPSPLSASSPSPLSASVSREAAQ